MDASRSAPIIKTIFFGIPHTFTSTQSINRFIQDNKGSNAILPDFKIIWPDKTVETFKLNWDLKQLDRIKDIFNLPTQKQRTLVATIVRKAQETFKQLIADRNTALKNQRF